MKARLESRMFYTVRKAVEMKEDIVKRPWKPPDGQIKQNCSSRHVPAVVEKSGRKSSDTVEPDVR